MSVFVQVWLWALVAFLLGALLTWILLVRPAHQRVHQLERRLAEQLDEPSIAAEGLPSARAQDSAPHADDESAVTPTPAPRMGWPTDPEETHDQGAGQRTARPAWLEADSFSGARSERSDQIGSVEKEQPTRFTEPVNPPAAAIEQEQAGERDPESEHQDTDRFRTGEVPHETDRAVHRTETGEQGYRAPSTSGQDLFEPERAVPADPREQTDPREQSAATRSMWPGQVSGPSADEPSPAGQDIQGVLGSGEDQQVLPDRSEYAAHNTDAATSPSDAETGDESALSDPLSAPPEQETAAAGDPESTQDPLPQRTRGTGTGIRGGFDPPKPIQPSMRPTARRAPNAEPEHGTSGSLFEPPNERQHTPVDGERFTAHASGGAVGFAEQSPTQASHGQAGHDAWPGQQHSGSSGPFGPGSATPLPGGAQPSPEFPVKASVTALRYCTEDSPQYPRMIAEVWFASSDEAERVGFRPLV